jgi:hypothetical protein
VPDEDDAAEYERLRAPKPASGRATAALVLGLLSFGLGLLAGGPAVVLAVLGLRDVRRGGGQVAGRGRAWAGLVCGCLGTLTFAAAYFAYPSMKESSQESSARSTTQKRLREIGVALHNYNDAYLGRLPPASAGGLSWRVHLLPLLPEMDLYKAFRPDEPWDGPHNKALLPRMPEVFAHPRHPAEAAQGLTYFRVFTGARTPFPPGGQGGIPGSFPGGLANGLLVVEAAEPVPWTKPDELAYDPDGPLPRLGGHFRAGFAACFGDAAVRFVRPDVEEAALRAAIATADGKTLAPNSWGPD